MQKSNNKTTTLQTIEPNNNVCTKENEKCLTEYINFKNDFLLAQYTLKENAGKILKDSYESYNFNGNFPKELQDYQINLKYYNNVDIIVNSELEEIDYALKRSNIGYTIMTIKSEHIKTNYPDLHKHLCMTFSDKSSIQPDYDKYKDLDENVENTKKILQLACRTQNNLATLVYKCFISSVNTEMFNNSDKNKFDSFYNFLCKKSKLKSNQCDQMFINYCLDQMYMCNNYCAEFCETKKKTCCFFKLKNDEHTIEFYHTRSDRLKIKIIGSANDLLLSIAGIGKTFNQYEPVYCAIVKHVCKITNEIFKLQENSIY